MESVRCGEQHRHRSTTATGAAAPGLEARLTTYRKVERMDVDNAGATFRHHRQRSGGFGGYYAFATARPGSSDATTADVLPPDAGDRCKHERITDKQQRHQLTRSLLTGCPPTSLNPILLALMVKVRVRNVVKG